jgi:hypothetical protein
MPDHTKPVVGDKVRLMPSGRDIVIDNVETMDPVIWEVIGKDIGAVHLRTHDMGCPVTAVMFRFQVDLYELAQSGNYYNLGYSCL